ncbi:MAG: hypothetical protein RLZZ196_1340 [Bacteroidota bacterium]|jgi:hypothetical protein
MTYITAHLPKLEDLKKELTENPDRIRIYAKYMGYEGSSESISYLEEKLQEYSDSKDNKK